MIVRLLRATLRPYKRDVAVVLTLVLIQSITNLYLPNLNADLINNGVAKGNLPYIWSTGAEMLVAALLMGFVGITAVFFASRTSMAAGRDLRAAIFERVQQFSSLEMNRFGTPSLITRNTNDVQQLQNVLQLGLTIMVAAPVMAVGGVLLAVEESVPLSGLLAVIVPLLAAVIGSLVFLAIPVSDDATPGRPPQPGAARADHRRAGDTRLRPNALRGCAISVHQR